MNTLKIGTRPYVFITGSGDDSEMCGITGWIDWNELLNEKHVVLDQMASELDRRGPDERNTWCTFHAAFGHTRLIVVDPEGGRQPMHRSNGEEIYTLIYNGELYNTEDLRKELMVRGCPFDSHSDTEVLLQAYMTWGTDCLNKLNGIFAFAIWDHKQERLLLARDRLGVKPLFYKHSNGYLLFGSEVKAILKHPRVTAKADANNLAEIFGLGPSRTPGSGIFQDIHELRPAHAILYDRNGLHSYRYWQVESDTHTENTLETAERVRELFMDSVKRQLISDVPIGTFLSGGVDSSAISAVAASALKDKGTDPLQTFSIDYEDNERYFQTSDYQPNSDSHWVTKMSAALSSKHQTFYIDNNKLADLLSDAVHVRDQPGMADVDSSLLWFCQQVKKQVTVALSGECADEIFGGYPWFHRQDLMDRETFPWMTSIEEREKLLLPQWRSRLDLKSYVQNAYEQTLAEVPELDGESSVDARRRELFYLNMNWFMAQLLDRKDRMSMGASLEVRVPFADHRLVEYVWNIPWQMKQLDNQEKGIFRKAMEGLLPDGVLYRKKSPYPKTHNPQYTQAVQDWMTRIVNNKQAPLWQLVDRTFVRQIVDSGGKAFKQPWFGQLMTGPQLMAHLAQINTWLEDYDVDLLDN